MRLETDLVTIADVTEDELREALAALEPEKNTRAILSSGDESYLQAALFDNGWVVEKRDGREEAHFHAVPRHDPLPSWRDKPQESWWHRLIRPPDFLTSECAFSKNDMIDAFLAYFRDQDDDLSLDWSPGYCDR